MNVLVKITFVTFLIEFISSSVSAHPLKGGLAKRSNSNSVARIAGQLAYDTSEDIFVERKTVLKRDNPNGGGQGNRCKSGRDCSSSQMYWESLDSSKNIFGPEWKVKEERWGKDLRAAVSDPAGGKTKVLRVEYPKGSINPGGGVNGGTGMNASPLDLKQKTSATFEYQVYFPKDFKFVLGGKLPGLYGGNGACSNGDNGESCFSTRFMWREEGDGELYLYADQKSQDDELCKLPGSKCNANYGMSLGRGLWKFTTGSWNTIRQEITLNSFDAAGKPIKNGIARIYHNNKKVFEFTNIVFRKSSSLSIEGIMFSTFFGGHTDEWKTPTTQYTYFKGFKLWAQ